jgi:hypothetical protein
MRRRLLDMMPVLALTAIVALVVVSPVAADNVSIGVKIDVPPPPRVVVVPPPPPVVLGAPPKLVVVSGSPVFYAPGISINFFAYGGRYYSFHEGAWFVATTHGGPWATIALGRVPQPVRAVPVAYYKIPPGHAKKMEGRGEAPGRGCPPGLAKQGRC